MQTYLSLFVVKWFVIPAFQASWAFETPLLPYLGEVTAPAVAFCLTGNLRAALLDPSNFFVEPFRRVVLRRFVDAGWAADIYVVTGGDECTRTKELLWSLRPVAVVCTDEEELTLPEKRWLKIGPRTSWDRKAFLGQLRKVRLCAGLFLAAEKYRSYQLVARGRLDVLWHEFPAGVHELAVPGIVWVPWRSTDSLSQYINDRFAIGRPADMRPYLQAYDALLDRGSWPAHRFFEATPDGLDTEELWETELLAAGILARQHRGICFNSLTKDLKAAREGRAVEIEDNCAKSPLKVHQHGYVLDNVLSLIAKKELPGQSEYDPLFTARLLHLWLAEWARIGRPTKIAELGCGRALMLEQWLRFYPASIVGIDLMPGVREILADDLIELDLAVPLFPDSIGRMRGCRFSKRMSDAFLSPGAVSLLRHCCLNPICRGVNLEQNSFGVAPHYIPEADDILLKRRNSSVGGVPPWASGQADWVVALDVASQIPVSQQRVFLQNVALLAKIGIILVWGAGDPMLASSSLETLGFVRDQSLEYWLWPFITRERYRQHLLVYRRYESGTSMLLPNEADTRNEMFARHCDLVLHSEWSFTEDQCHFGESFGCLDSQYIWVSDGCGGLFVRGEDEVACLSSAGHNAARSNWSYAPASWQYVECFLPDVVRKHSSSILGVSHASRQAEAITFCGPSGGDVVPFLKAKDPHYLISNAINRNDPLVSLRFCYSAQIEFVDADSEAVLIFEKSVPAGVCYTWNLWPATRAFYLRIRRLHTEQPATTDQASAGIFDDKYLLLADRVSHRLIKKRLVDLYDAIDSASGWGNQSQIWRVVSWTSDAPLIELDFIYQALRRLDAFALLLAAVRYLASLSADKHKSGVDEKIVQGLSQALPPWGPLGLQLLHRSGVVSAVQHVTDNFKGAEVFQRDVWIDVVDGLEDPPHDMQWRIRFAQTPLGRYLYHCATFSE